MCSTLAGKFVASSPSSGRSSPRASRNIAGSTSATVASSSMVACADAASATNFCRSRPQPPISIAAPSTSRRLPRIEPTIEALTTSCRPSESAKSAMISSGALPNVTFSSPPIPGPARCASSSVARPMSAAVGTTPSADEKKTMIASAPTRSRTIAIGMNGTSRYGQPWPLNRKRRTDAAAYGADQPESSGAHLAPLARSPLARRMHAA